MTAHVVCRVSIPRDEIQRIVRDRVLSTFPIAHVIVQLESEG